MKAVVINRFGSEDVLEFVDCPIPELGVEEVLIRVVASGVNPVDWKICEGRLEKGFPHEFPLIPGWELAGIVEQVAAGVTQFNIGDKVWAYARKSVIQGGTYAEYVVLPQTSVAHMTSALMFHEAAAIPLAGLTAWQCLFDANPLQAGQIVLIHGASGGVGHLAVQFAKSVGAIVVATAGKNNQKFVQDLGADLVIDYKEFDFKEVIRNQFPDGIDLVLDTIGNDTQTRSLEVLREGGHLVSIVSGPSEALLEKYNVTGRFVFVSPKPDQLNRIGELAENGKLKVHISEIYSLSDAASAHRKSKEGHVRGKLVLVM